jgi:hypothetical protein
MPIPPLTSDGLLPAGLHDCTLDEIRSAFGPYGRRRALFLRLAEFVEDAKRSGRVAEVIVDGSFVTSVLEPGDIDLAIAVIERQEQGLLRPIEYNVLSKRRVKKKYDFDILAAPVGSPELAANVEFFSQVKNRPGAIKGVLRVTL